MNAETNTNEGPPDSGASPAAELNAFGLPLGAPDNRKDVIAHLKAQGVNVANNTKNTELVKMFNFRPEPLPPAGTQPILPAGNPPGVVTTPAPLVPGDPKIDALKIVPAPSDKPPLMGVPPCPEEDPAAGEKTPAVVEWWFTHHTAEAVVKYQNRRIVLSEEMRELITERGVAWRISPKTPNLIELL